MKMSTSGNLDYRSSQTGTQRGHVRDAGSLPTMIGPSHFRSGVSLEIKPAWGVLHKTIAKAADSRKGENSTLLIFPYPTLCVGSYVSSRTRRIASA
jgi:hypothetical protein